MPRPRAFRPNRTVGVAIAAALTAATMTALAPPAQAATVTFFVASSGNDTFDCTASQPCQTVQRALDRVAVENAANGQAAVISVGLGSFAGGGILAPAVGTPTSLTLTGAGAGATTLVGGPLLGVVAALFASGPTYPIAVQRLTVTVPAPADQLPAGIDSPGAVGTSAFGILKGGPGLLTVSDVRITGVHGGRGGTGGTGTTGAGAAGGNGGTAMGIAAHGSIDEVRVTRTEITDVAGGAAGDGGPSTFVPADAVAGSAGGPGGSGGVAYGIFTGAERATVTASSVSAVRAGRAGNGGTGGPGGLNAAGGLGGTGGRAGLAMGIRNDGQVPGAASLTVLDSTVTAVTGGAAGQGGTGGSGTGTGNGGQGGLGGMQDAAAAIYGAPADNSSTFSLAVRRSTVTATAPGSAGAGGSAGAATGTGTAGTAGVAGPVSALNGGVTISARYTPASPVPVLQLAANVLSNPGVPNCVRSDFLTTTTVGPSDGGYNVASDGSCAGGGPGNKTVPNLGTFLGPLAGNGGLTKTIALIGGTNPAARAVPKASGLCAGTDQRGSVRPGLGAPNRCAAGAFEPQRAATCHGKKATIQGTAGKDKLVGTKKRDIIAGLGGRDVILGLGGNDLICGGFGRDVLKGGRGKDSLYGGQGRDTLVGGSGRDIGSGGPGKDRIRNVERQP